MPQLLKLKLPLQVGPKVNDFGTFLLEDDVGNKMTIIKTKAREDPEEMVREVLREWLAGKGAEVTWDSLVSTLRDCELPRVAEQIATELGQLK